MLDEVTPRVIVNAIDEMLLVQRGRELGLKMSDEQFNGILANIRKENKLDTEEKFQAALKQEGLTIPGLRKAFEKQMLINRVQQQDVFARISISEEESQRVLRRAQGRVPHQRVASPCASLFDARRARRRQGPTASPPSSTSAADEPREGRSSRSAQRVPKEDFATLAGRSLRRRVQGQRRPDRAARRRRTNPDIRSPVHA